MRAIGRIRPSKPASALALIVGIAFVGFGIFVVIPRAGAFGVVWTLLALIMTGYHASNLLSSGPGLSGMVVDFETSSESDPQRPTSASVEQRLAKLDGLRNAGLVSDEEYAEQRKRILDAI